MMDIEQLVLSLQKRIESLEQQLLALKEAKHIDKAQSAKPFKTEMSRNEARKYIMKQIVQHNEGFITVKGKRHEGSGIIAIHEETNTIFNVKFYHSNNHRDNRLHGWHKMHESHIDSSFDFYVFTVNFNAKMYSFVFSLDEMQKLVLKKKTNNNGYYHLYFEMSGGDFYETRDKNDK